MLFTWRASNVFEKKRHAIALDFTPEGTPIVHLFVPMALVEDVSIEHHVVFQRTLGGYFADAPTCFRLQGFEYQQQVNVRIGLEISPGLSQRATGP